MKKIILALFLLLIVVSAANAGTTVNFFLESASAYDGYAHRASAGTYPPIGTLGFEQGQQYASKSAYQFEVAVSCLKFNTSALPDDVTITSAVLKVNINTTVSKDDSRDLYLEYYTGNISSDCYTTSVSGNAAGLASSSLATSGTFEITLSNPNTYISKTDYTGFRMGIGGGQPTGWNTFGFRTETYTPMLVVTYSTPPGAPGNPTFTNVANKAMTISWTAATGATSYTLQRNGSNISTSATSPYDDSGLSVATSYTYRVIAVNADGSTNCAADQSQTTTYWSKKMNGSTIKKINGTYVDKVNGI